MVGILEKGADAFVLRSDMDGLPFQEESGEEFASQETAGCMPADMIFTLPCCWELQGF